MFAILLLISILICNTNGIKFSSRKLQKTVKNTIATAVTTLCFSSAAFADSIPSIGNLAPEFSLPSNRGKEISLSDYKGKRFVLYTYPGDFTSGCTIEAQAFERDYSQYKDLGVEILGLSVDSVEKHLDFAKSYNLEFPLVSDKGGVVSTKLGSSIDIPFIGKFSNRQTYIINDGKVEYVFTDVEGKIAKHSEEVLAKLKSLSS